MTDPKPPYSLSIDLLVPPVIETERLRLRPWALADFDAYAEQFRDEELARFIGGRTDRPDAFRRMAAVVGHWALRGHGYWAVEEREGAFAGAVGLWRPEGWPDLELGYWLAPTAHGKGYATEAGAAARDCAFGTMGAETLISLIHPENEPSMRVAERLGAEREEQIELLSFGPHWIYRYPRPEPGEASERTART